MSVMLYYAATKTVGVADLAQDEVVRPSVQKEEGAPVVPTKENEIAIDRTEMITNDFCIPMPESVKAEEVRKALKAVYLPCRDEFLRIVG